jgi:hypothetical protein
MHISTSVVAAASVCMYILLNVIRGFYVLSPHDAVSLHSLAALVCAV